MDKSKMQAKRHSAARGRGNIALARSRGEGTQQMWDEVNRQRTLLVDGRGAATASLEEAWGVLNDFYEGMIRREDRHGDTPFEAAMLCVELGFYPPPELLLTIYHQYRLYTHSEGRINFETALFGPPRRKAGNHAQRLGAHARKIHMAIMMAGLLKEGRTKIQAAEEISTRYGGKPEPESIVRMLSAEPFAKWIINRL